MNRETVDILQIKVDNITMTDAVTRVGEFIASREGCSIYTPNLESLETCKKDAEMLDIINGAELVVPDGMGVIKAASILGTPLKEKVSGVDLCKNVMAEDFGRKISVYLFGGKPGVAEAAAERIRAGYPNVIVAGCRNGYFTEADEDGIIEGICKASPDVLLVGLGAPKQEKWIANNRKKLSAGAAVGCGGTIDVLAGVAELAPEFYRKNGLEWFYRLCKQPSRFGRMLALPRFLLRAYAARIRGTEKK